MRDGGDRSGPGEAATGEGKTHVGPVNPRVMTPEPVQAKDHRVSDRDDTEVEDFGIVVDLEVRDDVMRDQTTRNGTTIHRGDRDRKVLERTWEGVAVSEAVGDARRCCAAVNERKGTDWLAVREGKSDIDEEMIWGIGVSISSKDE